MIFTSSFNLIEFAASPNSYARGFPCRANKFISRGKFPHRSVCDSEDRRDQYLPARGHMPVRFPSICGPKKQLTAMLSVFGAIEPNPQKDGTTVKNGVTAAGGAHPASPTHAKNLSPRPPISPSTSKNQKNLSASLADSSFLECSPALSQRGQKASPKSDKIYTFLPAWKRKSRNEIERIKGRKGELEGD